MTMQIVDSILAATIARIIDDRDHVISGIQAGNHPLDITRSLCHMIKDAYYARIYRFAILRLSPEQLDALGVDDSLTDSDNGLMIYKAYREGTIVSALPLTSHR